MDTEADNIMDFLTGFAKKKLTEEQKLGKALLELAKQHPPLDQPKNI